MNQGGRYILRMVGDQKSRMLLILIVAVTFLLVIQLSAPVMPASATFDNAPDADYRIQMGFVVANDEDDPCIDEWTDITQENIDAMLPVALVAMVLQVVVAAASWGA